MQKEAEQGSESTEAAAEEPKPVEKKEEKKKPAPKKEEKKDKKQADKKKETKKSKKDKKEEKKDKKKTEDKKKKEEQDDIPMDAAAIKAYSSVIADAAEDSEPQVPVQYHETMQEEPKQKSSEVFNGDPMASMIQNEISDIKDASIKAAKDQD